jgi:O-acetyl-ADP-ribose deacetylase (regulator of RNase III)
MKILIQSGDITKVETAAIVNAANTSLLGGGGVDGAIHKMAGPQLLEECVKIRNREGGCKTGHSVITSSGNLKSDFVIHTVGPVWNGGNGNQRELLKSCYETALDLCVVNDIKTVAFPNISTGIYQFPKKEACQIAIDTVSNYKNKTKLDQVLFVCYDDINFSLYEEYLEKLDH